MLIIIELECAVVSEVAPSILPLTFMLILYPYLLSIHIPTLTYTAFLYTRWSRDCSSVEWEPTFVRLHISTPKEATKVASETTD